VGHSKRYGIKRDEIEKYYRSQVNPEGQEPSQEEALSLKLNVTDQLINNEILLERAKKLEPGSQRRGKWKTSLPS